MDATLSSSAWAAALTSSRAARGMLRIATGRCGRSWPRPGRCSSRGEATALRQCKASSVAASYDRGGRTGGRPVHLPRGASRARRPSVAAAKIAPPGLRQLKDHPAPCGSPSTTWCGRLRMKSSHATRAKKPALASGTPRHFLQVPASSGAPSSTPERRKPARPRGQRCRTTRRTSSPFTPGPPRSREGGCSAGDVLRAMLAIEPHPPPTRLLPPPAALLDETLAS